MDQRQLPQASREASGWDRALMPSSPRKSAAPVARTVEGYSRMLRHFFIEAAPAGGAP